MFYRHFSAGHSRFRRFSARFRSLSVRCRRAGEVAPGAEGPRLEDGGPGVRLDRRYPLYFLIPVQKICMSKKLAGCWWEGYVTAWQVSRAEEALARDASASSRIGGVYLFGLRKRSR